MTEASGDDISDHPGEATYAARFKAAIGDLAYYIDEDKPYSGMREQVVLEFHRRLFGP